MPSKAGQQSNQIMRIHACFWSKMRCHDVLICVFCAVLLLICCYKAYNVPFSSLELIMVYCNLCKKDAVVVVCCLVSTALMRVGRHETDGFVIGHFRIQASLLGSIKASQLSAFQLICIAKCCDDDRVLYIGSTFGPKAILHGFIVQFRLDSHHLGIKWFI